MGRIRFAWFLLLACCSAARAENYAFLVGVGGYDEKELKSLGEYPRQDVIAFRDVLVESGFAKENVVLMVDDLDALPKTTPAGRYLPEARKIRRELGLLLPALERDDTLIVAFAGHGVQFKGEAEPYFCPADAKLADKSSLLSLTWLYEQLKYDLKTGKGCKPRRKLLLVDACRNDPASRLARAAGSPELESVSTPQVARLPEGVVALFSCAEGQQALQHDPLKHGIFFYHLLEGWKGEADGDRDERVTLDEVIAYTKSRTASYARLKLAAQQTPRQKGFFEGDWILRGRSAPDLLVNSLGMKLKRIPAGEFLMGSTPGEIAEVLEFDSYQEKEWSDNEQPQHRVRITQPYYLGVHEVTKGQFAAFVKATGYQTEAEKDGEGGGGWNESEKQIEFRNPKYTWRSTGFSYGDDHPVVNVSWNDAVAFCNWLSRENGLPRYYGFEVRTRTRTVTENGQPLEVTEEYQVLVVRGGRGYRLPTEAEWEYACRAGTESHFHHGDDPEGLARVGNVLDASAKAKWLTFSPDGILDATDGHAFTAPFGRYRANRFGLHDMHGNVFEWCEDRYDAAYYEASPREDPQGPSEGSYRVYRGGSWRSGLGACRSAKRGVGNPTSGLDILGFRVALGPSGK